MARGHWRSNDTWEAKSTVWTRTLSTTFSGSSMPFSSGFPMRENSLCDPKATLAAVILQLFGFFAMMMIDDNVSRTIRRRHDLTNLIFQRLERAIFAMLFPVSSLRVGGSNIDLDRKAKAAAYIPRVLGGFVFCKRLGEFMYH